MMLRGWDGLECDGEDGKGEENKESGGERCGKWKWKCGKVEVR